MLKQTLKDQTKRGAAGRRPVFNSATTIVPPGQTRSLGLGVYDEDGPTPQFRYTCTPDMGEMVAGTLDRLAIPGRLAYMLLYIFHNYGDKECRITVVREEELA